MSSFSFSFALILLFLPVAADAAGAARRLGRGIVPPVLESRYLARVTSEFSPDPSQLRVLVDAATGELQGMEVLRWAPLPTDPVLRYTIADLQAPPRTVPVEGTPVTFPPGAEVALPGIDTQGRKPVFLFLEGQPPLDRATARIFFLHNGTNAKKPSYQEFRAELVRDPDHAGQGYRLFAEPVRAAGLVPTDWLFLIKNKNFLGITIGIQRIEPRVYAGAQP